MSGVDPQTSPHKCLKDIEDSGFLSRQFLPMWCETGCCCVVLRSMGVQRTPVGHITHSSASSDSTQQQQSVNTLTLESNCKKFPSLAKMMDNHILSTSLRECQIFSHSSFYLSFFHTAMKAVCHRITVFPP